MVVRGLQVKGAPFQVMMLPFGINQLDIYSTIKRRERGRERRERRGREREGVGERRGRISMWYFQPVGKLDSTCLTDSGCLSDDTIFAFSPEGNVRERGKRR